MNIKSTIMVILTIMTLILAGVMSFFQYLDMVKNQNGKADEILSVISYELNKAAKSGKTGDKISVPNDDILRSLKKNFFYAVWFKSKQGKRIPVVYDRKMFRFSSISPDDMKGLHFTRRYPSIDAKIIDNNELVMWINDFNYDYYLQYIGIMLLTILLVYLVITLIINIIFSPVKGPEEDYYESDQSGQDTVVRQEIHGPDMSNEYNFEDYKYSSGNTPDKILADYKELWMKHFKISDHFKDNFPFEKILDLVKFGMTPAAYLSEALLVSIEYFDWLNPEIYLHRNGRFFGSKNGDILDMGSVNIPLKGDVKGGISIPLFPYNSSSVFGYLNFTWKSEFSFYIADILYFLKFLFSEDARFIFTDSEKNEKILSALKLKSEKKGSGVFAAILSVDNKHKFSNILKPHQILKIDKDFFNRVFMDFRKDTAFYIRPFYYGIIGERSARDKMIETMQDWISNENKHNYPVDNEFGNIAITYSGGLSFKGDRSITPQFLINEAENYQKIAKDQGGNQVVYS